MERLSAEDMVMLWPDEIWPQEICALAILDGKALANPSGCLRLEAVKQAIEGRLHLVPRFRQLLYVPRRGLGGPLWVDSPTFDLGEHVRVMPVPPPGDEAELLSVTEQLRRRRLDRSRPLWDLWLLPGLSNGKVGMLFKVHHAIADGIAAAAMLGALLDTDPHGPRTLGPQWTPASMPTTRDLFADNLRRHLETISRALFTRRTIAGWRTLRELRARRPAPAPDLNQTVGADRRTALIRTDLDLIEDIAHAHDATVNDVLLALAAAGLRHLLRTRGHAVEGIVMPVYVPVTLRHSGDPGAQGNRIGQMVVPLPVGEVDPAARLRRIVAATRVRKATRPPSLGTLLRSGFARRVLLKVLDRQPVNVTTADIPGPRAPMYLAGTRVLEVFPLLPLIGKVSLGIGALSYAGQFAIAAIADRDTYPDLDVLTVGIRAELEALATSTFQDALRGAV